jgi:predicted nicotinamide N-methyase
MCDFILHNPDLFSGIVLELGAGVGLVSILAGRYASRVFSTDGNPATVEVATNNITSNTQVFPRKKERHVTAHVYDWMQPDAVDVPYAARTRTQFEGSRYSSWTNEELNILANNDVTFVACDVLYDDAIARALLHKLSVLMRPRTHSRSTGDVLYLALERRVIITVEAMREVALGYDIFVRTLQEDADHYGLRGEMLDKSSYPQTCAQYTRTKYMELWRVTKCRQ